MKDKKAVLYGKAIRCPCCGTELQIGATVRLKCAREIGQLQLTENLKRIAKEAGWPEEDMDEGQEAGDGA